MSLTAGPDDARPLPRPSRRTVLAGGLLGVGGAVLSAVPAGAAPAPPSGRVISWGSNFLGELGRRGIGPLLPGVVPGLSDITAVAAGGENSYAIGVGGALWSWGGSAPGRIDPGGGYRRPGLVVGLPPVRAVAASELHALAVCTDGTVWSWGHNQLGELGDGTQQDRLLPGPVPGLTGVVAVAASSPSLSVALTADGRVFTWGDGDAGALGNGGLLALRPGRVARLGPDRVGPVTAIAAGPEFGLAVLGDGSMYSWGINLVGQLGTGSNQPSIAPRPIQALGIGRAVTVAANNQGGLLLNDRHRVKAWGQIRGNLTPDIVPTLTGITAIAGALATSYALRADGRVLAWGSNYAGELGRTTPISSQRPLPVPAVTAIRAIAAGDQHALALT